MKIVIDNNIILDALLTRAPFYENSARVLTACVNEHTGCLSANSLTDIFYVLAKAIGAVKAKPALKKLIELFEVISVSEADCINALELPADDFEDALLAVCAMRIGADRIITRGRGCVKENYPVSVQSPDEFLENVI